MVGWTALAKPLLGFLRKILGPLVAFIAGRRSAKAQQTEKALEMSEDRRKIDDEVRSLSDDALDERLLSDPNIVRGSKSDKVHTRGRRGSK